MFAGCAKGVGMLIETAYWSGICLVGDPPETPLRNVGPSSCPQWPTWSPRGGIATEAVHPSGWGGWGLRRGFPSRAGADLSAEGG